MPYFSGPNGIREVADPGERFLQSFQDSRRKRLLSDFFTSGQTDLGQLARLDPEAAQQIQAQQKQQGLAKMFADLYAAPEEQRPQGIAALLAQSPELGQQAMKMFDPRFAAAGDGTPSDIRSLQMLQGNPELLKLDRERRQASGMVPKLVQTDQGYGWGTPGAGIQLAPMGGVAGQPQFDRAAPDGSAEGDAFAGKAAEVANKLLQAGVPADQIDTIVQSMLGGNGEPLPESSPMVPPQVKIAQPRDQVMTPYQQAQLSLQEQAAKRAENADKRAQAEAERKAANPINAQAQREQAAIRAKVPQLQNAIRGMDRIETALKGLQGKMVNTGPMDAMVQRYTPAGQELEAAVGAIQNSVLALTRVPGIGSQSDLEARIAALQYPSLDKPPEVNRRTLDNLKLFMRDLANAYKLAVQPGQGQQAPAKPASGGPLRYNPATGDFD